MKTSHLITIGLLVGSLTASAQFNSGSSGAYGPLNIATNTTLDLPPDGILHCTTINVASEATLRFNRNVNNTPVYLLATADVSIEGIIDVSGGNAPTNVHSGGMGGPGAFDGGMPGDGLVPPGDGHGPGGGRAGIRSLTTMQGQAATAGAGAYAATAVGAFISWNYPYGYASTNKGVPFGSELLVPLLGGAGGGGTDGSPGMGGGGGGGALLVGSNTRIDVSGAIRANGGEGLTYTPQYSGVYIPQHPNPGSGGAIRLVAPAVVGTGSLYATGPSTGNAVNNHGRIRIDTIDRRNLNLSYVGAQSSGTYMVVFPPTRLDIVNVAGTNILEGSGPVTIQLPNDASTNQTVTVQARNFGTNNLPIIVALIPESGPALTCLASINNQAANPATVTVPVAMPVNTKVTISAWTKVP